MSLHTIERVAPLPDGELALIRGALMLALVLALVSIVFRLGVAIGWRGAEEELSWQIAAAKRAKENPPATREPEGKGWTAGVQNG